MLMLFMSGWNGYGMLPLKHCSWMPGLYSLRKGVRYLIKLLLHVVSVVCFHFWFQNHLIFTFHFHCATLLSFIFNHCILNHSHFQKNISYVT